jgi:acetylornithine deacetylase/succinyl-diaminopimelate desuccinylase-like protein
VPAEPQTTFCASVVGGGTSINAIPNEVWVQVDLRSREPNELTRLERRLLRIVEDAVQAENHARSVREGRISAEHKMLGNRPAGYSNPQSELVRYVTDALGAHGFSTRHLWSSTDANIAMSLGIPAVKIGAGGTSGRGHSLEEWMDVAPEPCVRGRAAGLAAVLAIAGVESD